ncbi:MAG: S41 family peptidase [Planctomycetota bacterium]
MTHTARLPLWFLVANMLVVLGAFALGLRLARRSPLPEPQATAMRAVFQTVLDSYIDRLDPNELGDRAIAAVAKLDDYSEYVPPSEIGHFDEQSTGTYEGIGANTVHLGDPPRAYIWVPLQDGPADRAGLQPGDRIDAIDGAPADDLERLTERLRGPAGSTVAIDVARAGEPLHFTLERASVTRSSVKWAQRLGADGDLGYVYLSDFHPGCADDLERAIQGLLQAPLRGLVLDLRFDGGGNFDECLDIARMFLREGTIVTLRRRGDEVVERYEADPARCAFPDLPLVLLMNRHSASASEVLAGALQDHDRAAVVGVPTYGKGHVNSVFQWKGLDIRLKLTTASYYTPNGRSLDRGRHRRERQAANGHADGPTNGPTNGPAGGDAEGGIHPDLEVALDAERSARVQAALAELEVPAQHRDAVRAFAAAHELRPPGIEPPERDPQLAAALALLAERAAAPATPGDGVGEGGK